MKALIFGTILFDIFPDGVYIGGCSTNVASHCGLLGAETTHLSRIGNDRLGAMALDHFKQLGVDTSFITVDDQHGTGRVDVTLSADGQPEYVLSTDAAYDYIDLTDAQIAAIAANGYDFIYFGTVDQRGPTSAATLRRLLETKTFRHVFCDLNLRDGCYTPESVEFSLKNSTILKLNEDELRQIPGILDMPCKDSQYDEHIFVREITSRYNIPLLLVTKSEAGATAHTPEATVHRRGQDIVVCDSVGAGDAFSSAFILKFIANGDLEKALDAGNQLGGFVASKKGAVPVLPDYPRDLIFSTSDKR